MIRLGEKVNLVICQKSKIHDWIEHFKTNYFVKVFDLTKPKEFGDYVGMIAGERFTVVGIINYELSWRRKTDLKNLHDFTLMLDESSLIQNRTAKQTKFILSLSPKNVILLSGTPTSGKYENLWTQAHLLGWDISNTVYQHQYVNWTKLHVGGGQVINVVDKKNPYKNVDRLKSKLREHGALFLKTEEVVQLPKQNFIKVKCESSEDYWKFMKDSILTLPNGDELIGDTILTKRICARKLCGMYSEEKLESFRDLVESTNDRIIVFYNFTEELLLMLEHVPLNKGRSFINGSRKDLKAYEEDDDSITFVQYQAGSMGINLQKANKIVYFSPPERCELWMQSQKRIHRIGQEKVCFYFQLICSESVEEDIYKALERGVDYTDELFREGVMKNGKRKKL